MELALGFDCLRRYPLGLWLEGLSFACKQLVGLCGGLERTAQIASRHLTELTGLKGTFANILGKGLCFVNEFLSYN